MRPVYNYFKKELIFHKQEKKSKIIINRKFGKVNAWQAGEGGVILKTAAKKLK